MNDKRYTYVTLLSTSSYLQGVIMLNWSLRQVGSKYPLFVLCSDKIDKYCLQQLERDGLNYLICSNHITCDVSKINLDYGYAHWNYTFDKLYIWSLTQFSKVVYLDTDMQVVRNIDFLFDKPHMSAVCADQWNEPGQNKLNSGLIVIEPNIKEMNGMIDLWQSGAINLAHVGDQDIIRAYYNDWNNDDSLSLDFGLNVFYSEVSAGVIREENVSPVSVIHYVGRRKPWEVSPIAIIRRLRHNFLSKYLLRYVLRMYIMFPKLIFKRYSK